MLGALTQNVDFKCNTTICFGVGSVHDQFKALQTTINRYSTFGNGFKPLVIDGFIGDQTVAAANTAATLAALPSPGRTHEAVAANALTLTTQLQDFINTLVILGALAPTTDPERAALAATLTSQDVPTAPSTAATALVAQSTPSVEIDGGVQQIVAACRASRSSPTCTRARTMCKSVRGTSQAKLTEIDEICDAVETPLGIWLLAGGIGVAAIIGIVLVRRHRRRTAEAIALGESESPHPRAFRRAKKTRR